MQSFEAGHGSHLAALVERPDHGCEQDLEDDEERRRLTDRLLVVIVLLEGAGMPTEWLVSFPHGIATPALGLREDDVYFQGQELVEVLNEANRLDADLSEEAIREELVRLKRSLAQQVVLSDVPVVDIKLEGVPGIVLRELEEGVPDWLRRLVNDIFDAGDRLPRTQERACEVRVRRQKARADCEIGPRQAPRADDVELEHGPLVRDIGAQRWSVSSLLGSLDLFEVRRFLMDASGLGVRGFDGG
mmetsp:Transcript_85117/g.244309  ORF Transcript_85117/g.244309 Transcript_85117/m.244309 type:complete len:245 (-) Transcript_85117:456-1190(-)